MRSVRRLGSTEAAHGTDGLGAGPVRSSPRPNTEFNLTDAINPTSDTGFQGPVHVSLQERHRRIAELWRSRKLDVRTYFGMLLFVGIESGVKIGAARAGGRTAYAAIRDALEGRTRVRGLAAVRDGGPRPTLDERDWAAIGLGVDRESMEGSAALLEQAALAACAASGVDPVEAIAGALLAFARLDLSVRSAPAADRPKDHGTPLGGEPDSAHFFSFAELGFWCLEHGRDRGFWLGLTRGAVAAQPVYLAVHYRAARRVPRGSRDYGPGDVLRSPEELRRRLAAAPEVEDLSQASETELVRRVGRNARRGLLRFPV